MTKLRHEKRKVSQGQVGQDVTFKMFFKQPKNLFTLNLHSPIDTEERKPKVSKQNFAIKHF